MSTSPKELLHIIETLMPGTVKKLPIADEHSYYRLDMRFMTDVSFAKVQDFTLRTAPIKTLISTLYGEDHDQHVEATEEVYLNVWDHEHGVVQTPQGYYEIDVKEYSVRNGQELLEHLRLISQLTRDLPDDYLVNDIIEPIISSTKELVNGVPIINRHTNYPTIKDVVSNKQDDVDTEWEIIQGIMRETYYSITPSALNQFLGRLFKDSAQSMDTADDLSPRWSSTYWTFGQTMDLLSALTTHTESMLQPHDTTTHPATNKHLGDTWTSNFTRYYTVTNTSPTGEETAYPLHGEHNSPHSYIVHKKGEKESITPGITFKTVLESKDHEQLAPPHFTGKLIKDGLAYCDVPGTAEIDAETAINKTRNGISWDTILRELHTHNSNLPHPMGYEMTVHEGNTVPGEHTFTLLPNSMNETRIPLRPDSAISTTKILTIYSVQGEANDEMAYVVKIT